MLFKHGQVQTHLSSAPQTPANPYTKHLNKDSGELATLTQPLRDGLREGRGARNIASAAGLITRYNIIFAHIAEPRVTEELEYGY